MKITFEGQISSKKEIEIEKDWNAWFMRLPDANPSGCQELQALIESNLRYLAAQDAMEKAQTAHMENYDRIISYICKTWTPEEVKKALSKSI